MFFNVLHIFFRYFFGKSRSPFISLQFFHKDPMKSSWFLSKYPYQSHIFPIFPQLNPHKRSSISYIPPCFPMFSLIFPRKNHENSAVPPVLSRRRPRLPAFTDMLTRGVGAASGEPSLLVIAPTRELAIQIQEESDKWLGDNGWLVVTGTFFKFPDIGYNHPNWLDKVAWSEDSGILKVGLDKTEKDRESASAFLNWTSGLVN